MPPKTPKTPKTLVILQSSYIPWKGYFDLMNAADVFVLFDEVQYSKGDWRNRNRIVINGAAKWLTIPVASSGTFGTAIAEIRVSDPGWARKHWRSIQQAYARAPFFATYREGLEAAFATAGAQPHLSAINRTLLGHLAPLLGIGTEIRDSTDIPRTREDPVERLIELCQAHGATRYLSGPAAQAYIDPARFEAAGITLAYADYAGYPEYPQRLEPFEHGVSAIDLLMHTGPEARTHLKSSRPDGLIA